MPIASYKLPDGRIVDYEVPEGMSPEEIDQAVASDLRSLITPPPAPKQEESGFFRQALDVPVNVAKGAVTGVRMIADAFGANNPVSDALTGAENYLGDLLSAQAKNDQQEIARIMKEAEDKGILEQVKAGIKALTVAPVDLLSNALGTAAPTLVGGLAAQALRGGALATGALMGGTGAVMGAGTIKGEIYQATKQALLDAKVPEDQAEARAQLAQSYGGQNLDQILLGTAIGGLAATTGVEKALVGPLSRSILGKAALKEGTEDIGKLTAGRALKAAGKEAIPEGIQGGQEQLAQNVALQREGFDVPTMRGVVGQAALEGLVGGILGGAVDVAHGSQVTPRQPAPPPPGTTETETTRTEFADPATMTPAQRYVELFNLRRGEQTDETKARIAALEEMNVQDIQRMLDERSGKEPTSLEEQIKQQPPLQMEMRDFMQPETGVRPADQFAGPERGPTFVLTPEVLERTGLRKQSGFFRELVNKDLSKVEDQEAVKGILQKVRANKNLTANTKTAIEDVANRAFVLLAQQQEMFGPRGGVRPDADMQAQEERKAAQEAKAAEKAAKEAEKAATAPAPTVDETAQTDLFTEEAAAEPETKAEIPDTTISEKTFEQLGVGPTNKKLREQILGKDLTDAAQAAEVRDALEDFANAPNRSKKLRDSVEQFLAQPFFAGEQRGTVGQPGATDTGAGQPSVSVPGKGQPRPTEPVPLDLRGLGSSVQDTGTTETGKAGEQRPLKRFVDAAAKAFNQLREEGDPMWEELEPDEQAEFMDAFAETKPKMKRYRLAAEGTQGMPADKVRKLVDRLTAKWKNPPDIFVVQSVAELADYGLTDIDPTAKGVFYGGDQSVFLIADNITDYNDAVLTVAHESIGHFGLQSVLGDKYNATMDRLYETNEEVRTLADKKIKEEGLDKRAAVEEVLAEAVEKKITPNSGLGRAIATLRNLIRNFLNLVGAKATNSEIDALIAQAANYVVGGTVQVNKSVTDTDAFKNWFGDSVIRNPDGSPKIMYHGTAQDISTFRPQQAKAIFVTDSPEFADVFTRMSEEYLLRIARETGTDYTGGRNILPLYVRAEKPFDYESKADVNRLMEAITKELEDPRKFTVFFESANIRGVDTLQELKYSLMTGNWRSIETPIVQDFIRSLGFDSFYVKENGRKNLAVYEPNQVKSATGNAGSFSRDTGDIRYKKAQPALTAAGEEAQSLLEATKGIANEKARGPEMSTIKKVGAFFLDPSYRQNVVDKLRVQVAYKGASVERKLMDAYNGAIRDSLGNIRPDLFMTAAEHTDTLTVAGMKEGGIRLDKNIGWVAEKRAASMTGVMDSIKALGQKLGDQDMAFKLANNAFIARRAKALKGKGIVDPALLPSDDKIEAGLEAFKKFPELEAAFQQFTDYKNGLIDAMVEGGRLSKEKAQEWKDAADYVPWNRIKDFEETIQNSPQMFFKGLTNLKQMKAIKGGTEEINDIFDNMVGLSFWMVNSAVRNHAALQLTDAFVANNLGAKRVYPGQRGVDPNKTIYIYRNGEPEVYEFDSIADVYAFKGVESVGGPLLKSFTAMSNFLRKTTTAMPQFAFSQLPQDAYRATVMSGTRSPFKVAAKVFGGFIDAYKGDATTQRLEEMGIVGMYDLMPGRAREEIEKEFGLKQRSRMEKTINALESFSIASDTALRKAVFEQTLEETKSEQFPEGDVLLARYRAQEIINFKRQGSNRTVGILRQMVPFMNAYIQGMDVFYRTATGRGISAQERGAAFRLFLATGVKLMALSFIYAALVGDADEYKGLRDYEKDKNFIFPGTGVKVPVAPEVAFFFKVLPERAYHYITSQGTDTPQDATALRKALGTAMFDAFTGPNLTPQAIKPLVEIGVNYSFFTGTPIVGRGMENREARYQFTSSTSELAKMLGDIANVSPLKIDYFLRGTTGIAGGTALDVSNMLVAGRPERNLYQMPFFKTFMYNKIPGGYKEQYYDLRNQVDQVADTMNALKAQGRAEELEKYLTDEKLNLLALRKTMNKIDQKFKENRVYKNIILNDPSISGPEKTKLINEIEEYENEMLRAYNIADLRKNVAGL